MGRTRMMWMWAALLGFALTGCDDEPETPADPELEAPEAPEPTATSRTFTIDRTSSKVDFVMAAPLENIHGVADRSMEGDLYVDLADLTASRGLVKIDLDTLEIFQQKRESEDGEFGEEVKNETQNEHTRTWFQISDDAPEAVRDANRWIQFNVTRISDASATNVLEMEGAERTVTATIHGDFHLHGHTTQKSAQVELVFLFEGDEPRGMKVRTVEPVNVGLEEHDVRPRSAFGTLAQATLGTLGQKVAEAAPITFELTANAGEPLAEMPPCALDVSEEATAACALGASDPPGEGGIPETE
jgi:polyisoprenoid-binding protein YceI